MDDFRKLLNQFRCEKGQAYTHTSIGNPKISLCIPNDKLAQFYEQYNRAMVKGTPLHLTEKPENPSPMRADLDFRFALQRDQDGIHRIYKEEHIERILAKYFDVMDSYLDVSSSNQMTAYVMEKPAPVEYRGKIKDGLHIIWPHLIVDHSFMHLVRKKVLDDAPEIFQGIPLCNTFEDVIDQAIIDKNNWQLYGSRKPDAEAYRVTKVYKWKSDTGQVVALPSPSAQEELQFVQLFAMRGKRDRIVRFKSEKQAEVDEYIRHVLPTIDERRKLKLHNQVFGKTTNLSKVFVSEDELILARQLVTECLNPRRAENYEEWVKLGWTLRNIDFRLLDVWIEFSRVSSKYIEGECQELWNRMRVDTMGMGTLRWWARFDNPLKYQEILDNNLIYLIDQCIGSDGAHYDVARVVHAMYKDRYRFTTKDVWYMFREDKHRWVRTREGLQLRNVLSNDVCRKFMERSLHWGQEASKGGEHSEILNDKAKKLTQISIRLKTAGYKDCIMKECKSLFTDENFEEVLDSHPHLLGFENGVYDLRMHEFRGGMPDDYISFTTGRNFVDYVEDSQEAQELRTYMSQVFTNADVRKYMMDILACIIDGSIRQEKFYIYTGSGCHAIDTPIMMADGSIKMVQDVQIGDQLMGDDSTPRNVMQLFRGTEQMYKIIPIKGDPFVVNQCHKLALRTTKKSEPRVLEKPEGWIVQWNECIYSTKEDGDVLKEFEESFSNYTDAIDFMEDIRKVLSVVKENEVHHIQVKNYIHFNMNRMHLKLYRAAVEYPAIPVVQDPYVYGQIYQEWSEEYRYNSREIREKLFQGAVDANHGYKFDADEKRIDQIIELARGLGYTAYKEHTDDGYTTTIECKLDTNIEFAWEDMGEGSYYGFEVDKNHRYLMGDFMVTANSNSKSIWLNMIQKAIGDYYCILPIALLTQKRASSNSAQSELERTKGRRLAVMQEPGENEKLNIGLMKELTGGDRILVRGLFKEPIEFRPQFKMVMTCNELPEVPSDDGGTWRRIRVVEYTSKFLENPNPTNPKEFPLDPDLLEKMDRWVDMFISMIIHHHQQMDPKNIHEPMEVRIATEGYKKNNDVIGQFVSERMERDDTVAQRLALNKVFLDFKTWAGQVIPKGKKLPDRNQFRAYMEKQFGVYPSDGKGWRGIRYTNQNDAGNESDIE